MTPKTPNTQVTTSIILSQERYDELQALATRTHRSFAAVVREAVDLLLERERKIQSMLESEQVGVSA